MRRRCCTGACRRRWRRPEARAALASGGRKVEPAAPGPGAGCHSADSSPSGSSVRIRGAGGPGAGRSRRGSRASDPACRSARPADARPRPAQIRPRPPPGRGGGHDPPADLVGFRAGICPPDRSPDALHPGPDRRCPTPPTRGTAGCTASAPSAGGPGGPGAGAGSGRRAQTPESDRGAAVGGAEPVERGVHAAPASSPAVGVQRVDRVPQTGSRAAFFNSLVIGQATEPRRWPILLPQRARTGKGLCDHPGWNGESRLNPHGNPAHGFGT